MGRFPSFFLGDVVLTRSKAFAPLDLLSRAGQAALRLKWPAYSHAAISHSRHTILDAEPFERIGPRFVGDWMNDVDLDTAVVLRPPAVLQKRLEGAILRNFARPYNLRVFNRLAKKKEPSFICSSYVADVYAEFFPQLRRTLTLPVDLERLLAACDFTGPLPLKSIDWTDTPPDPNMTSMLLSLLTAYGRWRIHKVAELQNSLLLMSGSAAIAASEPSFTAILPLAQFISRMLPSSEQMPEWIKCRALNDFAFGSDDLRVYKGSAFIFAYQELDRIFKGLGDVQAALGEAGKIWNAASLDLVWQRHPSLRMLGRHLAVPGYLASLIRDGAYFGLAVFSVRPCA